MGQREVAHREEDREREEPAARADSGQMSGSLVGKSAGRSGRGSGAGVFALFRLFPLRGAQGLEDVGKYHLGSILWVAEKKLWWVICP